MKYPPGFVPVDFQGVGKILLALGIISLILKGVTSLTGWLALPDIVFYLGLVFIIVSLYLIFVVPKPE